MAELTTEGEIRFLESVLEERRFRYKTLAAAPNHDAPEPRRGKKGLDILGPVNADRARQEPDHVRPPATDAGKMANMKWSFTDSHMRLEEGGWARETTVRELPSSRELAGVNMRLGPGVYRELHWHHESEWAYIIKGGCFIDDLEEGDLWYFPTGFPHGIQGTGDNGVEFLLIFDDGNFSEDSTFLLTDYMARTPQSVLAKNFRVSEQVFNMLSQKEKYIFEGQKPGSLADDRKAVRPSKHRFTHRMLKQEPLRYPGGTVRITDSTNFPVSKTTAAAHVTIKQGGLREMHWHPNADEWSFFLKGHARVTIFAAEGRARTFDYVAGDVGIVPKNNAHYVENIGEGEVEMLEMFRAPKFEDFSTEQWLANTPGYTDPIDNTHRDADEQVDLPKHALAVFERELMVPAGLVEQTFRVVKLLIGVEALFHVPGFERSWWNDLFGVLELHDLFLVGIVSLKVRHCVRDQQCVSFRAEGVVYSVGWRHIEAASTLSGVVGPERFYDGPPGRPARLDSSHRAALTTTSVFSGRRRTS